MTLTSVTSKIIEKENKKIGYIYVSIFALNTASQFKTNLNELEKNKRLVSLDEVGEIAYETPFEETGVMQTLQRVLNEEEQRIVCLHVLWGYKHREIAEIINSPTGTVTSKYKRAVEKLKRALKEEKK